MFCMECGGKNEDDHAFCIHCGIAIEHFEEKSTLAEETITMTAPHVSPTLAEETTTMTAPHVSVASVGGFSDKQKLFAITIGSEVILFAVIYILTGHRPESLPRLFFFFVPLILGTVVYLARNDKAVSWVENSHVWITSKCESKAGKDGFVRRWFLRPLLFGLDKTMQWTDGMKDPYFRAGVRTTVSLYFIGLMISLALISIYIVVVIVLFMVAMWILFKVLDGDEGGTISYTQKRTMNEKEKDPRISSRGKRIWDREKGKYTQEIDKDGKVWDREKGKYTQEIDKDGKVWDREKGKYTQEIDKDGKVWDREKGKYTQEIDKDGKVWDREKGKYTQEID